MTSARARLVLLSIVAAGAGCPSFAHVIDPAASEAGALVWSFDPLVLALLAVSAALYLAGFTRLRARSRHGRAVRQMQAGAFAGGLLALVAALVSPVDALGASLFSAHMLQHELMMIVAAPLLVIGRPLAVWLWAFPAAGRLRVARALRSPPLARAWRWITLPLVAWALHAVALWGWHAPLLFEAALRHPFVHTLQHWSFLLTALLFWWTVIGTRGAGSGAHAMLSLFTTMVHTSALGALLTLAPGLWYPSYAETTAAWGVSPLQDQQLGGLVMWVPGGLAYVIGGLAVAAQWLVRRDRAATPATVASP